MSAFFTGLLMSVVSVIHPFYISMTDINYNSKTKTLQISVRIFTDDLEKTLRKNCNCKVDLTPEEGKVNMNTLVSNYIQQHLQIRVNTKLTPLRFIGFQNEESSTWCYFEGSVIERLQRISVYNSLLHDYKPEQINMIHINALGKNSTEKLNYPNQFFEMKW